MVGKEDEGNEDHLAIAGSRPLAGKGGEVSTEVRPSFSLMSIDMENLCHREVLAGERHHGFCAQTQKELN